MCPSREFSEKNLDLWRPWLNEAYQIAPTQNNSSVSPLKCNICFRSFKRDSELRRHKNSKHLRKVEYCKICKKQFTRRDNLTRHLKMAHLDKGKPSCQFCRKPLSRQDAVQRHEARCPKNLRRGLDRQLIPQEEPSRDTVPRSHLERLSRKHPGLNSSNTSDDDCSGVKRLKK